MKWAREGEKNILDYEHLNNLKMLKPGQCIIHANGEKICIIFSICVHVFLYTCRWVIVRTSKSFQTDMAPKSVVQYSKLLLGKNKDSIDRYLTISSQSFWSSGNCVCDVNLNDCVLQNSSSWVLYNMASFYWRMKNEPQRAVDCVVRALHFSPR